MITHIIKIVATTLFISDLHLEPQRPDITRLFINFLQNQAVHADALYILGDLFEVWIGDDEESEFHQTIIQVFKNLTHRHVRIYFMPGNRDFLIGKKFLEDTGCLLLTDPTMIDLYGVPVLLMHGDLLCTQDKRYLYFRTFVRNRFIQKLFLGLPIGLRQWIAQWLRNVSQHQSTRKDETILDANFSEVKRLMLQHNVPYLIHGHTHRPSIQYFKLKEQNVSRIVLSDWHTQGNVLVWNDNGGKRLLMFDSSGLGNLARTDQTSC